MPLAATELDAAMRFSRYAQRLLTAEPALRDTLLASADRPWDRAAMEAFLATQPRDDEAALKRALRALRKRVMLTLMVRDLTGRADLDEVMACVTTLAELSIEEATQRLAAWLEAVHGAPIGRTAGTRTQLIVVGMGKLGGSELNVSSDVDLIYLYPEEGQTTGPRSISNHEYFTRLAQKLTRALADLTEDGHVFRVDLRLRPYGESGPVVASLAMLEEYLLTQGREWERYAWIKGRVISGPAADVEALVRPFVYRKYLDYGAFASMRALHAQIRQEVARRDFADNIKLGPGGIREIEFITQVFQLIRGGKEPALQLRPTRAALDALAARGLLGRDVVERLKAAYAFLRRLEHRLQYLDDAQTHSLPGNEADRHRIAAAMGEADWAALCAALDAQRKVVAQAFEEIFAEDTGVPTDAGWGDPTTDAEHLALLGYADAVQSAQRLAALKHSQRYGNLPERSRLRFDRLVPLIMEEAARHPGPDATLARMLSLLETIARRESYLALLAEYPETLAHVAKVCAASPWAAEYLRQHPILLDELIDRRALLAPFDWPRLAAELRAELGDYGGTERQLDTLRHFKHAQTFRLLAQDLEGLLPIERLADELSALADIVLGEVLRIAWLSLARKHCETPRFAIIGYGKLGGRELGYASDLDIVFLYDDAAEAAPETYARLAQRINSWLTTLTPAGVLYETDLRLRPDGAAGLMVSSLDAFRRYQRESAWVWEHQALTRARFVAGHAEVGAAFEAIRRETIAQPRDLAMLRREIAAMRQKMREAHPNASGLFDLKHDPGGIVDVEFSVQYLVLAHGHAHAALLDNVGNLALLERAGQLGLIPPELAEAVRTAYRNLRRHQHRLRMAGMETARLPPQDMGWERDTVRRLWRLLFESPDA